MPLGGQLVVDSKSRIHFHSCWFKYFKHYRCIEAVNVEMAFYKKHVTQRPQHFPPATVATLTVYYHQRGMVGVGESTEI